MKILLRHTLRSVKDNIGQLIVILLTVTVVSAMFFVTLTIGGLFTNLQTSLKSRLGGDTDISISGGVFSTAKLEDFSVAYADDIDYIDTYLQIPALFRPSDGGESKVVLCEATELNNFSLRHNNLPVYKSYEFSYGYPEIWIGRSFAEENNIEVGDNVEIYMETYGEKRTLTVTYIFENVGYFANSVINNVLMDYSAVGNKGIVNLANIKLKDGADKGAVMEKLGAFFEGATVGDSVDYAEINRIVSSNQRLLNVALVFVTALMLFILFTSFLVIAKKRVNELNLFRAAGASPMQIIAAMLAEGLIYGFVGAVLGAALGRIGLGIAADAVIPNFPDAITFGFSDYAFSILFGTAVSGAGSVVPVMIAGKKTVRKGTSDTAGAVKKRSPIPFLISAAATAGFAIAVGVLKNSEAVLTVLLIASAAVFAFFAVPYVLKFISFLIGKIRAARVGSMGVKRNPVSQTLSGMTAFIMVFTFVTVSIVNVIIGAVTPFNARFNSDFVIESASKEDLTELKKEVERVYGVVSANIYFYDTFIYGTDTQNREYTVYGADNAAALKNISQGIDDETMERFDKELHPLIISYDLVKRFGISVGDKIKLTLSDEGEFGKTLYDEFTVIGVDYTTTADDRIMIIRNSSFRIDGKDYVPENQIIFVDTNKDVPNDYLYMDLRDRCESKFCYVLNFEDWAYATSVGIRGVGTLLRILQAIVGIVALIGVINLTIVSLLERKKEFNVFRAAGMDGKLYLNTVVSESFIIALSGAIVGTLLSAIVNLLMPSFAIIIDRLTVTRIFPWEIAVIAATSIAVYVLIYVFSAVFRRKRDVIERNII